MVDLVFVAIVVVGLLLVFVPGILAFVWLGLAGPVVEIEDRTAARRPAPQRLSLVRGNFWLVFLVLAPIELVGDAIGGGLAALVHDLLGDTFLATWLAESVSNVVLAPVFAVAAVLLTLDLMREKDGEAPPVHLTPVPA